MPYIFRTRYSILGSALLFCLVPFLTVCWYLTAFQNPQIWKALGFGFLIACAGGLFLYYNLYQWISKNKIRPLPISQPSVPAPSLPQKNDDAGTKNFTQEIEKKKEEILYLTLEIDKNLAQYETLFKEFSCYKVEAKEQFEQQHKLINELKETIAEQRAVIEKKQSLISQLENKVSDLTYEIKTLLHLAESMPTISRNPQSEQLMLYETPATYSVETTESEPQQSINSPSDASIQLKRCLDIAQKMTGSSHFGGSSRFRDISVDNFALDLRRLCDSLRSENSSTILLYSPKEEALLFANNQIKHLSGWSPEKFVQNFSEIVQDGMEEWKQGIAKLSAKSESKIRLVIKTRTGQDILVQCHLGMIPTGIFRHNIIGILYA